MADRAMKLFMRMKATARVHHSKRPIHVVALKARMQNRDAPSTSAPTATAISRLAPAVTCDLTLKNKLGETHPSLKNHSIEECLPGHYTMVRHVDGCRA